ncbi:MAG: peptide chain release factor N(5)-glutamine methyltransferase, partial [Acidobacteriota bacterium]
MTVQAALRQGFRLLEQGAIAAPRLTAEVLLCHALGCERPYLYSHPEAELAEAAWLGYRRSLDERLEGKPTQYITGRQEFYGREFLVTPDVLIPRPETEHVVETALALARDAAVILDAGCGSGAIAVTLSLETGRAVWATDISPAALAVAAGNSRRLGARVHLVECDVTSAIAPASVDLVVSNPPYVPAGEQASLQREVRDWEPPLALYAGPAGLDFYRRLITDAARILRPAGWMVVELGFKTLDPVR